MTPEKEPIEPPIELPEGAIWADDLEAQLTRYFNHHFKNTSPELNEKKARVTTNSFIRFFRRYLGSEYCDFVTYQVGGVRKESWFFSARAIDIIRSSKTTMDFSQQAGVSTSSTPSTSLIRKVNKAIKLLESGAHPS